MAWVTAAEVLDITGVDLTLTPSTVMQANEDINMVTGITDDATLHARDEHWLGRAVAWQAVWLAGQPGNAEQVSTTTVSQEGLQATYTDELAIILAPRARRCLKNLSWMGTHSVLLTPRTGLVKTTDEDPPDEYWTPFEQEE